MSIADGFNLWLGKVIAEFLIGLGVFVVFAALLVYIDWKSRR
jgi:hypothetical protein